MPSSRSLLERLLYRHQTPRQQLVDSVDGMLGDTLEHRTQIHIRFDAIQACRADQAVDDRRTLSTAVRTSEQIVAPAENQRPDRSLRGVVIYLDAPVFTVAHQRRPIPQRIPDRLAKARLHRDLRKRM